MGDVATYEISLSLLKSKDIKQKTKNSKEDITVFLSKYKNKIISKIISHDEDETMDFDEDETMDLSSILNGVSILDSYDNEVIEDIIFDIPMTYQEFIDNDVFINNESFKKYVEDEWIDTDEYGFDFLIGSNEDELIKVLEFIDLNKLQLEVESDTIYLHQLIDNSIYDETPLVNSSYNSIYCDSDNSTSTHFTITQEFIDSLKPGHILKLSGDGRGSNC